MYITGILLSGKKKTHNIVYSLIAFILKNTNDTQVYTCIRRPGNLFQTIDSSSLFGRSGRVTVKGGTSVSSLFVLFDPFYNEIVLFQ